MFTEAEIKQIRKRLLSGDATAAVAKDLDIALSTLRDRLRDSGYRITTLHDLEPIVPVGLSLATEKAADA